MEENNKPELTNPSTDTTVQPEITVEKTLEEQINERVMEGINQQKASDNLLKPIEGGLSNVVTNNDSTKNQVLAQNSFNLDELNAASGRVFKDKSDFLKHYDNLKNFVGTKVESIKPEETKPVVVESYKPQASDENVKALDDRLAKLEDANQRLTLKNKYPFATEVENEIAVIAKATNKSYVEVFEQSPFKNLLEQKAKEESQKSPVVTPKTRIGFDTKKVEELGRRVLSYNASEEDKQALVAEVLGIK